jgi:hypothetical protein
MLGNFATEKHSLLYNFIILSITVLLKPHVQITSVLIYIVSAMFVASWVLQS